jgi:short-subunit dehydrogenase
MSAPHCCIVGAGPGIGLAVAEAFAREGFDLSLIARRPERLARERADLAQRSGRRVQGFAADASEAASLRQGLDAAAAALGPVQVLVYNVASAGTGRPLGLSPETLLSDFRANVMGALVAAQTVAPAMRKARRGTILFTGGGFAHEPAPNYASLSLGKAALRSLTHTLAQELGADGVHVATVTVHGFVQPGTHFDPARIAQAYLALHRQTPGHFEIERVYK